MKEIKNITIWLEFDKDKHIDFKNYLCLKKKIDNILMDNNISDIPEDPIVEYSDFDYIFNKIENGYDGDLTKLTEEITEDDFQIKIEEVSYSFDLDGDCQEFINIKNSLDKLKLYINEFFYTPFFEFSELEMNESDFYIMDTSSDEGLCESKKPINRGTKYDEELICDCCGLKKWNQKSTLHFDTNLLRKRNFLEHGVDYGGKRSILISKEAKDTFLKENFTGFELEPVIHVGNINKQVECYQLKVTNIVENLSYEIKYVPMQDEYCSKCNISGRSTWPLTYDKKQFEDFKDFNITKELFNRGAYIDDTIIVSKRVKDWFNSNKIKHYFEPITFI